MPPHVARHPSHRRIAYLNVWPLFTLLAPRIDDDPDISCVSGHPADLNAALRGGDIDVAPASAFAYLRDPDGFRLLPDLSIAAAVAPIQSVLLVSPVPVEELAAYLKRTANTVLLSSASASSNALLRVLWRHHWRLPEPRFEMAAPGTGLATDRPFVEIGDTALRLYLNPPPAGTSSRPRPGLARFHRPALRICHMDRPRRPGRTPVAGPWRPVARTAAHQGRTTGAARGTGGIRRPSGMDRGRRPGGLSARGELRSGADGPGLARAFRTLLPGDGSHSGRAGSSLARSVSAPASGARRPNRGEGCLTAPSSHIAGSRFRTAAIPRSRLPCRYRTVKIRAFSSDTAASHALPVRRASALPAASLGFHPADGHPCRPAASSPCGSGEEHAPPHGCALPGAHEKTGSPVSRRARSAFSWRRGRDSNPRSGLSPDPA